LETAEQVSAKDLRRTDVFAGLSDFSLEQIASLCSHSIYETGEYCAVQGEKMDHMLIVNGGKVAVEMQIEVPPHTHAVTIATLTKGRVCAWSALVPPNVLTASVRCVERAQMISIGASDLQSMFEQRPSLGYTVLKNLAAVISSRLTESRTQLERLVAEVMKQGK
jgi:CRP-like cAMP-binding protein